MRWTNAGLFLLIILFGTPGAARGQATGEVQSIGFNGAFRPDCWVPMVVRLKPDVAEAGNYQIQVFQHDLDGDRAAYVRNITLNGNATAAEQLFWMYFLPQPTNHGLPDQTSGTLRDLQKELVVFLCDAKGKQLVQLPVTSTLNNVDPYRTGGQGDPRGRKLVLAVSGNGSQQPPVADLVVSAGIPAQTVGLTQDVEVVNLRVRDLPESALGYEPVDAVLWLDGDPGDLDAGGAHGLAALRDYVRFGGQLVVTQPTIGWQQTAGFGDLMPVDVTGVAARGTFEPLQGMALSPDPTGRSDGVGDATGQWARQRPPYQMARATPRPGSVVEDWIDWSPDRTGSDRSPYLARRAVGLGQVTWVAQPLTTEAQPINPDGWPYVWMHVFGWRSDAYVKPPQAANGTYDDPLVYNRVERYTAGNPVDLGYPLIRGELLNLNSKGAWLIVLAIGFFVVYWLLAGPGTYAYLMTRRRQALSWFFFAAAALVATAVTVGVVKLVLRGPPQVRHLTMVRVTPGQPAIAYSRFGLYIPRDGDQTIELEDTTAGQLSYLSALAEHPQQLGDEGTSPAPLDYDVPVREASATDVPSLTVPYRSSLKKFQARWVGELPTKIGSVGGLTLAPDEGRLPLRGTLTNETGLELTDVYLAFRVAGDRDWMVYVPTWPKDTPIDLQRDLAKGRPALVGISSGLSKPGDGRVLSDELAPPAVRDDGNLHGWANYFYSYCGQSGPGGDSPEQDRSLGLVYPMLSLLDRLPPMPDYRNVNGNWPQSPNRAEFLARGARQLDAGPSVTAGQLLILATVKGPLPIPVQVEGSRLGGDGVTLYQFMLPIDRSAADAAAAATTRPAATRPAEK